MKNSIIHLIIDSFGDNSLQTRKKDLQKCLFMYKLTKNGYAIKKSLYSNSCFHCILYLTRNSQGSFHDESQNLVSHGHSTKTVQMTLPDCRISPVMFWKHAGSCDQLFFAEDLK